MSLHVSLFVLGRLCEVHMCKDRQYLSASEQLCFGVLLCRRVCTVQLRLQLVLFLCVCSGVRQLTKLSGCFRATFIFNVYICV